MSRRKKETASLPETTVPSEPCLHDDACELVGGAIAGEYGETFSDDEDDFLSELLERTATWDEIADSVKIQINEQKKRVTIEDNLRAETADRGDRRRLERTRDGYINYNVAQAHNNARFLIRSAIGDTWTKDLVAEKPDFTSLSARISKVANEETELFATSDEITKLLTMAFLTEHQIRLGLQFINVTDPATLQNIFNPATLSDLPAGLQKIAVIDIMRNHGKDSILLDNTRKILDDERSQAEKLADYIKNNHLPESVKVHLLSIHMGMRAMGAPTCPFNDLGICTKVLAKVPELPEPVRKDMALRQDKEASDRVAKLTAFARQFGLSPVFDSSVPFELDVESNQNNAARKRRVGLVAIEKRHITSVEDIETDTGSFSEVYARIKNGRTKLELRKSDDEETMDSNIELILGEKMFDDYLATYHNNPKLRDAIKHALKQILLRETYGQMDRTIVPWLDMKQKGFENEFGVTEKFMRYSGSRATGVSGGELGRRTRIIFSQGTKDDARFVTFHAIMHRTALERGNPTLHRR